MQHPTTHFLLQLPNYARNRRLQRDLFAKVKTAVRPDGLVVAIVHRPDTARDGARTGRCLVSCADSFNDWEVLWDYEGPSRDPAHRRPVAEIVAQRDMSPAGRVNGVLVAADTQVR